MLRIEAMLCDKYLYQYRRALLTDPTGTYLFNATLVREICCAPKITPLLPINYFFWIFFSIFCKKIGFRKQDNIPIIGKQGYFYTKRKLE
jgi:hypothetical protein